MHGSTKPLMFIIGPVVLYCKPPHPPTPAAAELATIGGGAICRTAL
jgi:hypothetical protein